MKLSEKKFKKACEMIARKSFSYMKMRITKELNCVFDGNQSLIDEELVINIILGSLALLDVNMIFACKNLSKDLNVENILQNHYLRSKKIINDSLTDKIH